MEIAGEVNQTIPEQPAIVEVENENTDDKIDCRCQKYSDHLFVKYLIFKELGDMEQAEYFKNKWINKRTFIKCTCKGIKPNEVTNEDNTTSTTNSDNNAE